MFLFVLFKKTTLVRIIEYYYSRRYEKYSFVAIVIRPRLWLISRLYIAENIISVRRNRKFGCWIQSRSNLVDNSFLQTMNSLIKRLLRFGSLFLQENVGLVITKYLADGSVTHFFEKFGYELCKIVVVKNIIMSFTALQSNKVKLNTVFWKRFHSKVNFNWFMTHNL